MTAPFKGRREDFRLVTGQGRYTADWNLPNQAHGHFLRADRAVPYGEVMLVLNALRDANYLKVALVGLETRETR